MKVNRKPRKDWTYPQDPPPRTTGHKPTPDPPAPAKIEVPTGLVTPNPRPEPPPRPGVILENSTWFQAAMGRLYNSLDGMEDACELICKSISEMKEVIGDDVGDDK